MDDLFQLAAFALLAAFGALARQLQTMGKEPANVVSYISGCVIAAFMGVIIYFISENMNLGTNIAYALGGISGWLGPQVFDFVTSKVLQIAGINLDTVTQITDKPKPGTQPKDVQPVEDIKDANPKEKKDE